MNFEPPKNRKVLVLLALLAIVGLGAGLRLLNLGSRGYFVPDEEISVKTGDYYILGNATGYGLKYDQNGSLVSVWPHPYNYEHPPLAKVLIGVSGQLFSHAPLGYRLLGASLGAAIPFMVFLIGRKFMSDEWALLPAAVGAVDPILIQVSRLATPDVYYVFFAIAAVLALLYLKGWPGALLSSLLIGASIASKWLGFYPLLAIVLFQVISNKGILHKLSKASKTLIVSLGVYVGAFYQYFAGGPVYTIAYGNTAPSYLLLGPHSFADFASLQAWMVNFAAAWHVAGQHYGYVLLSPLTYVLEGNAGAPMYVFNILLFLAASQVLLGYLLRLRPPLLIVLLTLAGLLPLLNQGFVWYLAFEVPAAALMIAWYSSRAIRRGRAFALLVPVLLLLTEVVFYLEYLPR